MEDRDGKHPIEGTGIDRRGFFVQSGKSLLAAGVLAQAGRAWPSAAGGRVRMGVVGGNFGATFWWHEHPNAVVTAVTDLREDRRENLRKRYRCDAVYPSLEVMVQEAKNVDAVAVFSGAVDHAQHVRLCMENGWHVVSACPACFTVEEAQLLKEVKERTGLRYMMAESSYYRGGCILARNLFEQGALGEIFYTEAEYYHDRGDLKHLVEDRTSRFYEPDGSKSWRWGLAPQQYPTHGLGYLVGVTGERVTEVSCLGWGTDHPYLTDNAYSNPFWNEASLMRTNKGHACRNNVFWLAAASGERAQWFGSNATLYMPKDGVHDAELHFRNRERPDDMFDLPKATADHVVIPEYWKTADMIPEPMRHTSGHGGSAVFISAEFINALLEDREPAIDLYHSLAMTVPGIVAHTSAKKDGERLVVPQFDA